MHNHNDEHTTHVNHLGSFWAGALFGGLAGTVAILLLAPQSGKKTRTQIQLGGVELKDQLTEAVDNRVAQTRATVRQITTDVREKAKTIQHDGQEMLAEQRARLSAAVAGEKTAYQGARD
jgi:gas vesicle protein